MTPNLLLVILDCLRRDYWRYHMPLSRELTRGWFQLNAHWAVAHCSDPNISALLTGFGPWQSKITTQMGSAFEERLPTMFRRWKKEIGGTVWAVEPLKVPAFYRDGVDLVAWHKGTESADLELRAVRQFLSERDESKPWLGFLRDMTCHYPYMDLPAPPRGDGGAIPQYEQAVAHVDQFVSNLVEFILSKHPNTIIVICSDHGELLGEHGEWDHLYTLYNILVNTPMAVYVPDLRGKRTKRPTQHVDLWPTLCDLLGLDRQGEGISWAPWMRGETQHPCGTDRLLWLQGTGAGPTMVAQAEKAPLLDPGHARVLWRHRAAVKGTLKLTENVHASEEMGRKLTQSTDYKERRDLDPGKPSNRYHELETQLPPLPDYHEWEKVIVADYHRQVAEANDAVILERLEALGYA